MGKLVLLSLLVTTAIDQDGYLYICKHDHDCTNPTTFHYSEGELYYWYPHSTKASWCRDARSTKGYGLGGSHGWSVARNDDSASPPWYATPPLCFFLGFGCSGPSRPWYETPLCCCKEDNNFSPTQYNAMQFFNDAASNWLAHSNLCAYISVIRPLGFAKRLLHI